MTLQAAKGTVQGLVTRLKKLGEDKDRAETEKGGKPGHDPHNFSFSANKNENSEMDESF